MGAKLHEIQLIIVDSNLLKLILPASFPFVCVLTGWDLVSQTLLVEKKVLVMNLQK